MYLPNFPLTRLWISNPHAPMLIGDVATDERMDGMSRHVFQLLGWSATVIVPLTQADKWVGLLSFNWDKPREFSPEEQETYQAMIGLGFAAIENRRLLITMEQERLKLKQSEERFEAIIKAIPIPIVVARLSDGAILYVNEHSSRLVGNRWSNLAISKFLASIKTPPIE